MYSIRTAKQHTYPNRPRLSLFCNIHALSARTGNNVLGDDDISATDPAKRLGMIYGVLIFLILVVVVLHSMLAKKEEMFQSTMASMVLIWLVLFEMSLGSAYLSYSMHQSGFKLYNAATFCQILVCGGCAMIITFFVNFTHNGNLTKTILEDRASNA